MKQYLIKTTLFLSVSLIVFASACRQDGGVVPNSWAHGQSIYSNGKEDDSGGEAEKITYGDTVTFDNLEFTFNEKLSWTYCPAQYSAAEGETVICFPVTVRNVGASPRSINMFLLKFYAPDGAVAEDVSPYFTADDILYMGDIPAGGQIEGYMHVLYAGDGDYVAAIEKWELPLRITLNVKKPKDIEARIEEHDTEPAPPASDSDGTVVIVEDASGGMLTPGELPGNS